MTRTIPSARGFIAAVLLAASSCGSSDDNRPTVVLVTLDTTRADHLGCYGYEREGASPRIDALAEEGVLFESAISQAAVTPVSHASIFTGLNPFNHGLRVMHSVSQNTLRPECVTLAEVLRDEGYETGAFVSAFPVTEYFGFRQGFDHFDEAFDQSQGVVTEAGSVNTGSAQRHAGATTDRALAWMRERDEPFFLWLHYFDPHDPKVMPPPEELDGVSFPQKPRERLRAIYAFELTYMDRQLGRVFDELERMGLWDEAVVVVTSDHGEGLGDHDWWTHGLLYQEQVRVPLVVKAPGIVRGHRVASVVRSIDILPTVGELLGLGAEDLPVMDGASLVPLLRAERDDLGLEAYSDSVAQMVYRFAPEMAPGIVDDKNDMHFAVVVEGRWKFIFHLGQRANSELYDLESDPQELRNLYDERPDVVERANAMLKEFEFVPTKQLQQHDLPPDALEKLSSLGYTGEPSLDEPSEGEDDESE